MLCASIMFVYNCFTMKYWPIFVIYELLFDVSSIATASGLCPHPTELKPKPFKGCIHPPPEVCYIHRIYTPYICDQGKYVIDRKMHPPEVIDKGSLKVHNESVSECIYKREEPIIIGREVVKDLRNENGTCNKPIRVEKRIAERISVCMDMKLYEISPSLHYLVVASQSTTAALLLNKTSSPPWFTDINGLTVSIREDNMAPTVSWMASRILDFYSKENTPFKLRSADVTLQIIRLDCLARTVIPNPPQNHRNLDDSAVFFVSSVSSIIVLIFFVGSLVNATINYLTLRAMKRRKDVFVSCSLLYLFFPALLWRVVFVRESILGAESLYAGIDAENRSEKGVGEAGSAKEILPSWKCDFSDPNSQYVTAVFQNHYEIIR